MSDYLKQAVYSFHIHIFYHLILCHIQNPSFQGVNGLLSENSHALVLIAPLLEEVDVGLVAHYQLMAAVA